MRSSKSEVQVAPDGLHARWEPVTKTLNATRIGGAILFIRRGLQAYTLRAAAPLLQTR